MGLLHMTNQIAMIIGAFVIGLSIVGAQFIDRYAISATSPAGGQSVAFRLNKFTGDTQLCFLAHTQNEFAKIAVEPFEIKCSSFVGPQ